MNTHLAAFATVHLVPDPAGTVPLHELADRWNAWAAERGIQPGRQVDVVRGLVAAGVVRLAEPPVGTFLLLGARLRDGAW